ncbi:MAG: isoprenylcysteine carboxylmethyltransferase family protein, partial [Sedimentisphaerales bacterium]|nr:isoprenylcysteine carboxylmethyltransferase family protein [Sedimentisphaerales bacterium]
MIPSAVYLWRVNPEIFVARGKIHAGTKPWDKVLLVLLLVSFLAILVVAPLDAGRFHWSSVPLWLTVLGYILLCVNFFLSVWAESVNQFAEPSVRIQTDRGHKVVDTGPYAIVRHPMYLSGLFLCAGIPLTLGSFWALIPAAVATVVLIVRTIMEDKTLQKELEGYKEY